MRGQALYVYGLVRSVDARELGPIGLEHEGRPGQVGHVPIDRVSAVVSPYASERRVPPLRRNLEPHHRVIRETMAATTIVPMAFGHVVPSRRELIAVMRPDVDRILEELRRLDGKVEMGLRVEWNVQNVFKHLVDSDPVLARYRERLFGPGAIAPHAEKLELGRLFEDRLRHERSLVTERLLSAVLPCVSDTRMNPPRGEQALADFALLIERRAVGAFEALIRQIAASWHAEYVFQYNGPWAPFSFVELELTGIGRAAEDSKWAS